MRKGRDSAETLGGENNESVENWRMFQPDIKQIGRKKKQGVRAKSDKSDKSQTHSRKFL